MTNLEQNPSNIKDIEIFKKISKKLRIDLILHSPNVSETSYFILIKLTKLGKYPLVLKSFRDVAMT